MNEKEFNHMKTEINKAKRDGNSSLVCQLRTKNPDFAAKVIDKLGLSYNLTVGILNAEKILDYTLLPAEKVKIANEFKNDAVSNRFKVAALQYLKLEDVQMYNLLSHGYADFIVDNYEKFNNKEISWGELCKSLETKEREILRKEIADKDSMEIMGF